jgi:hypothetical protein
MKNYFIFFFLFCSVACNANILPSQADSVPQWNEFKKMKKSTLAERYKDDPGALRIINNKTKSSKGVLLLAGGVAALSVLLFILGDILTIGISALGFLFYITWYYFYCYFNSFINNAGMVFHR